jgi:hypothetical protein
MRFSSTLLPAALAFVPILLHGQDELDAVRTATMAPGGTARSTALGNAFGALGADPVAAVINPAGLALYQSSAISISLGTTIQSSYSDFYGSRTSAIQGRVMVGNAALVLNKPDENGSGWSRTFALIYDRGQNLYRNLSALGSGVSGSLLQTYVREADGTAYSDLSTAFPFSSSIAWTAYGINTVPGTTDRYFAYIPEQALTQQRHTVEMQGSTNRTCFAYSGNYRDRLYIGGALNLLGHRLNRVITHTEETLNPTLDMGSFTLRENLATRGTGVELGVGAIWRFNDRFRAGASFMSPQWYLLSDAYSTKLNTTFRTPDSLGAYTYEGQSPDGTYSYRLSTPWRTTVSAAYIAGQYGSVSLDYEFADMRTMRYRTSSQLDDTYDFAKENSAIKQRFRALHTVRVGTEWRVSNWYWRGGFSFVPDAFRPADPQRGQSNRTFSAGTGYRWEHLTLDLTCSMSYRADRTQPYDADLVLPIDTDWRTFNALLTLGFRP